MFTIGDVRDAILTPDFTEVNLDTRGFTPFDDTAKATLELAGRSFLTGFSIQARLTGTSAVDAALAEIDPAVRGFAYEGAGMAATVRDALPTGSRNHLSNLLMGTGFRHKYLVHIGAGWAFAQLPRPMWKRGAGEIMDPILGWLALDGYGFHEAYFHPDKFVHAQKVPKILPWPPMNSALPYEYAWNAVDQGIGRALWFVEGADPERIMDRVESFPAVRRSDLAAGVGLAATYAGGVDRAALQVLVDRSGPHRWQLAQGAAFAAQARTRAGNITDATRLGVDTLCNTSIENVVAIVQLTYPQTSMSGRIPAYESWRREIAAAIGEEQQITARHDQRLKER